MTVDLGALSKTILEELLSLVGKTSLKCDGKIYRESRRLTLGDFVLSKAAAEEMGLGQANPEASSVLGMKIIFWLLAFSFFLSFLCYFFLCLSFSFLFFFLLNTDLFPTSSSNFFY